MSLRTVVGLAVFSAWVVSLAVSTAAQSPAPRRAPAFDMQMIADALGVQCEYCHGAGQLTSVGKPRIEVAREMMAMTTELNSRIQFATVKTAADAVRVDCATCHRGVPVPKPLRDLLLEAAVQQGPEEATRLYRDLRAKYYGSQTYDFSENSLLTVADRLAQTRPQAAIMLADLNLEFFPKSWRSHLAKGIAQSRRMDTTPDAVESFKKALEIDPGNGIVQGWLAQTEPLARRVR